MDKEVKAKWVAALRSGRYEQTRESLSDERGFCCLGVLAKEMTGNARHRESDYGEYLDERWAEETCGLFFDEQYRLSKMNDNGCSFLEIADYIEKAL